MNRNYMSRTLMAAAFATAPMLTAHANPDLIAAASIPASYEDLNNQTAASLENGVPGNRLGGLGSSIAYAGGSQKSHPFGGYSRGLGNRRIALTAQPELDSSARLGLLLYKCF
jgi:hypothetical protein